MPLDTQAEMNMNTSIILNKKEKDLSNSPSKVKNKK